MGNRCKTLLFSWALPMTKADVFGSDRQNDVSRGDWTPLGNPMPLHQVWAEIFLRLFEESLRRSGERFTMPLWASEWESCVGATRLKVDLVPSCLQLAAVWILYLCVGRLDARRCM